MKYIENSIYYIINFIILFIFGIFNLSIMQGSVILQIVFLIAVVIYFLLGNYKLPNRLLNRKFRYVNNKFYIVILSKIIYLAVVFYMIWQIMSYNFDIPLIFMLLEFILSTFVGLTMTELVTFTRQIKE